MGKILTISALLLTAVTLLPISKVRQWLVRGLDFPRLQIVVLLIVWLLASLLGLAMGWGAVGVTWWLLIVACLAYQLWWIAPYSPFYPVEAARAHDTGVLRIFRLKRT